MGTYEASKLLSIDTCELTQTFATQAIAHSADIHTPNATIVVQSPSSLRHKVTVEVVMCV